MGLSSINFSGLGTGIDTESVIKQLIAVEQRPQTLLQDAQKKLQQRQAAYNTVSAQLLGLQASASVLDRLRAFDLVTATTSDSDVATVTADTGAQTGAYAISVTDLAKAQVVSFAAQSSQTTPLGFTGQILVNGKAINVSASDSLSTLASNINAAGVGVTASILSPTTSSFVLTLGSNNSGLQGRITLSDTAGNTFLGTTLGLFGAGTALRNVVSASVAGSSLFTDSATSIATLQGQTAAPATTGNVTILGTAVTLDLSKSLSGIAADINAALGGTPATVVTTTDPITKASRQQLQISGVTSSADFTDNNNVLANLGFIQRNYNVGRELTAAQDAAFTVNGLAASRPTNTFSDVISGVTINLLKDGGAATNLTVSSDTARIKTNISDFVKAFNSTIDSISSLSQFDPDTGATGPLFGDSSVQSIVDGLVSTATGQFPGLPSSLSLLSQVGITLDQSNYLTINESTLSSALTSNLQGVAKLFRSYGTASDPAVQFVSSTVETQASTATGYTVSVTTPASQATLNAGAALGSNTLAATEVLTFGGPLFGTALDATLTSGYAITLQAGRTLDDIVSQINGDATLGRALSAFNNAGTLQLISKTYGAAAQFGVLSSVAASTTSSGIGTTMTSAQGVDVVGSINGETAAGSGQFLTGSQRGSTTAGNGKALGLQIRLTAASAGSYGTLTYTAGAANLLKNYITTQTDAFSGVLTSAAKSLQENIDDISDQITTLGQRLKSQEALLRDRFAAMEVAVIKIRNANAGLAQLAALNNS